MAGDWIKMRSDLGTDPAVILISHATGLDPFGVVGRLHALWAWADAHTTNGTAPGVTAAWIDRLVCHQGFATALCATGWLIERNGAVELPRFTRHMSKSAKKRIANADRQRRYREKKRQESRNASVTLCVTPVTLDCHASSVTREEKRREEKKERQTPLPPVTGVTQSDEEKTVGRSDMRGTESFPDTIPFDPLRAEQGDRKDFERRWRESGLRPFSRLDKSLWGLLASLLADPWWAEHYPLALAKAGTIPFFASGANRQRGPLDVSEFLRDPDLCRRIIDGVHDPRPTTVPIRANGKPTADDVVQNFLAKAKQKPPTEGVA